MVLKNHESRKIVVEFDRSRSHVLFSRYVRLVVLSSHRTVLESRIFARLKDRLAFFLFLTRDCVSSWAVLLAHISGLTYLGQRAT